MKVRRLLASVSMIAAPLALSSPAYAGNTYIMQGISQKTSIVQNYNANAFYQGSAPYHYLQATFNLSNGDEWIIDADPSALDAQTQSALSLTLASPASKIGAVVFDCPTPAVTFTVPNGYSSCDEWGNCYWVQTGGQTRYYMLHVGTMSNPGGLPQCTLTQTQVNSF